MGKLELTGLARLPLVLLEVAEAYDLDRREVMQGAGLTDKELEDPDARVDVPKMWDLWRIVIDRTGDPHLGLHVGMKTTVRRFGLVGYTMYYSPNLREALLRMTRYSQIISKVLRFALTPGPEQTTLGIEHAGPFDRTQHPVDARLAGILTGMREITQSDIVPVEVRFPYEKPRDTTEHQRFFQAPLTFEQPSSMLVLKTADLERPVLAADETLSGYLDNLAEESLSKLTKSGSFASRVRRAIWAELSGGAPTLKRAAAVLGTSARTLQRRLREEGTSFATVLDQFRQEMALRLLRDPGLAVYEVAFLLGYSEPSTFYRAFRRWRGTAPDEFRKSITE